MPRSPRHEFAAGVHHVFARGNDRRRIFLSDDDRRIYLSLLKRTVERRRWLCLAYCLMPNHVHLLIETQEPNLGTGMHWLHAAYASTFNARYDRSGHLFQGRYGSVRVESDEQLWTVARYLVRNPVEAGLCARPEEYPWSSHREALAERQPRWIHRHRLLEYFDSVGGDARRRYADYVGAG